MSKDETIAVSRQTSYEAGDGEGWEHVERALAILICLLLTVTIVAFSVVA